MESQTKVINEIVASLNEKVTNIEQIIGHGSVNQIYIVTTATSKLVVRLNDDRGYDEFIKEKWCIERAISKGVPEIEDDICSLMLLRAIDKLRWAIDKHQVDVPAFTTRVKEFYQVKFG